MTVVDTLLLVGRVLLAGVFVLAGVAKLRDGAGSRQALIEFGVPEALATPGGTLLPLAELAVAITLIPRSSARYGAVGALLLLLLFVASMGHSLARGRRPDCHCFGQLYSAPIGWQTLVRNGVLAAVAGVVAVVGWQDAGPSVVAWLSPLTALERATVLGGALAIALLGMQSGLLVAFIRQHQQLLLHLTTLTTIPVPSAAPLTPVAPMVGLPVGALAPPFALPTLDGDILTLDGLRAYGKPVVLLFSDPSCGPCNALLPEIGRWQAERDDDLTVALLSRDTVEANRAKGSEHGLQRVLLQRDREVAEAYAIAGTPSAVLVRPDGTIGSVLAQGADQIRELVVQSSHQATISQTPFVPDPPEVAVLRIGEITPDFTLPDLDGNPVALADLRGQPTLALFWDPGCGYCNQILNGVTAWEKRPLPQRARLLVISAGEAEDIRAQGFRSTVVLDPDFAVSARFGVQGTPSAALIDAEGRLSAPLGVGAAAVFALMGQPEAAHASTADDDLLLLPIPLPLVALSPDARPLPESCVQDELLEDGTIILHHGCQQQTMTLNPTAALIWACCDGDHDVAAIVAELREVFPNMPDAERDVRELLSSLMQAGMLTPATI